LCFPHRSGLVLSGSYRAGHWGWRNLERRNSAPTGKKLGPKASLGAEESNGSGGAVNRAFVIAVPLIASCGAIAGCGGSSTPKSNGTTAASGSAAAATTGASRGSYGGGAYGGSGSASGSSAASAPIRITTKHNKLGTILAAGPKQLTVYLFEGDKGSSSNCSSACANAWPPVTASAIPAVAGSAMAADLGTISRSDGTKQVAYRGHPLYYFVRDKDSGDAYGQGVKAFGASWYVLAPTGKKIDNA
jgi:predicted lipoprotein with Yx(FWY)xxD motif